jgi:phage terminase small subunit
MNNSQIQPKPPKNMSLSAKKAWKALAFEYGIRDAIGIQILTEYCQALQRAEESREKIRIEGSVIEDRFKQRKEHPACVTERGAVSTMLACLKALNLDIEPLHDHPGRPLGR